MTTVHTPAPAPLAGPDPMEPVPHRVTARHADSPHVVTLQVAPMQRALPTPQPGQFMMLWVFGVGEVPISVSNVRPDGSLDFTVQAVGATSLAITTAQVGDLVGLRGPFGTAWPLAEAMGRDVLVMAGGLGLAPLRMAVEQLATTRRADVDAPTGDASGHGGDDVGGEGGVRSLTVLVGAREPAGLLFPDDLHRWQADGATVLTTVDTPDAAWLGNVGVITTLLAPWPVPFDLALVCGPEAMMAASATALLAGGMPADRIHVSLERNMHCGVGHCGRCQVGPLLLCRDGAVVRWDRAADLVAVRGR